MQLLMLRVISSSYFLLRMPNDWKFILKFACKPLYEIQKLKTMRLPDENDDNYTGFVTASLFIFFLDFNDS